MWCLKNAALSADSRSFSWRVGHLRSPSLRSSCVALPSSSRCPQPNHSPPEKRSPVFPCTLAPLLGPAPRRHVSALAAATLPPGPPPSSASSSPAPLVPARYLSTGPSNGPRIRMLDPALEPIDVEDYDIVCDVRTPAEHAEDRVIGATCTPVLSNEERVEVGTLYKHHTFEAKKLGAALVSVNMGRILREHFFQRNKHEKVLVYCWRGGERSAALAHTLCRVGFDVTLVDGGYRAYRRQVSRFLEESGKFRWHIISGKTGVGKGRLLEALREEGAQVVDLEAHASHRGSILGEDPATGFEQPSQKMFDSRMYNEMKGFDPARPVFVEGESSRIGVLHIPCAAWQAMKVAPHIVVEAPMAERVAYLREGYRHFETSHVGMLREKLRALERLRGKKRVAQWLEQVEHEQWDEFVESILEHHYDPGYMSANKKNYVGGISALADAKPKNQADTVSTQRVKISSISAEEYARVAKELVSRVQ